VAGVDHGSVVTLPVHRKRHVWTPDRRECNPDFPPVFDCGRSLSESLGRIRRALVCATVADESPAKVRDERECHALVLKSGILPTGRAAIGVHDSYFRVVRDVETACRGVKCHVIPVTPFRRAQRQVRVFLSKMIAALRGSREKLGRRAAGQNSTPQGGPDLEYFM